MSDVYDVLIAGGGPSGSALARTLALGGFRTLLVDRSLPGASRVCGGFLGPETSAAFEALGLPEGPACEPLETLVLSSPRIPSFERGIPGIARGVRRDVFDAWLFAAARDAGSEALSGVTFAGAERAGGGYLARLRVAAGGTRLVHARLVADATGRRPHAPGGTVSFGCKALYSGVSGVERRIALHFVRGGNVGLNPVGRDLTALCFYVSSRRLQSSAGGLDALVKSFAEENPSLAASLSGAKREGEWTACQAESDGRTVLREGGHAFTGDAAAMIHPVVGGGISLALFSGILLGACVAREGPGERAARLYAQEWPRRFESAFRWAGIVGTLRRSEPLTGAALRFFRACPAALDPLVQKTRPSGIKKF